MTDAEWTKWCRDNLGWWVEEQGDRAFGIRLAPSAGKNPTGGFLCSAMDKLRKMVEENATFVKGTLLVAEDSAVPQAVLPAINDDAHALKRFGGGVA